MAVKIEFESITGDLVRGFRESGREADKLERALGKTAKEARNVREAALSLERAEGLAARAARRWGRDHLNAATASMRAEKAQERLTRELREATGANARLAAAETRVAAAQARTDAARAKAIGNTRRLGSSLVTLARRATMAGAAMAGIGVGAAVKSAVNFEQAMSRVQAKLLLSRREMAGLNRLAIDLGAKTEFSASEAAAAMEELAAAGFSANRIFKVLPGTMALASASGADLAQAAAIQTSTLNGFGLAMRDAGRVADVLAQTANASAADIDDMQESIKYIAPVARASGQELESMMAAIGLMANVGIKGSQSGTTLRTAMVRLQAPVKRTKEALADMGLTVRDLQGPRGLIPMPDIIGKMVRGSERLDIATRNGAIASIFGREALSGMVALIERGEGRYRRMQRALEDSTGAADRAQRIMRNNVAGAWEQVTGAVESAAIALTGRFMPDLQRSLRGVSTDIDGFTDTAGNFLDGLMGKQSQDGFGFVTDRAQQLGLTVRDTAVEFGNTAGRVMDAVFAVGRFVERHEALRKILGTVFALGAAAKAIRFAGAVSGVGTLAAAAGLRGARGSVGRAGAAGGRGLGDAAGLLGLLGLGAGGAAVRRRLAGTLAGLAMRGGVAGRAAGAIPALTGGGGWMRFAATRALPAYLAYNVGAQAITGRSPIRNWADARGTYRGLDLPTTGGGFRSMLRDLRHWNLQQPEWESKARKFGDRLQDMGSRLNRLDSSSLRRLGAEARTVGRNFEPASQAMRAFASDVDATLGRRMDRALDALRKGPRWQTAGGWLLALDNQFRLLPERMKGPAARAVIEAARAMERNGRLPQGATQRIIDGLTRKWDGLPTYLRSVGRSSARELERTLKVERIANGVERVVRAIKRNWQDAPRTARTTARSARDVWQTQMEFLREKMRNTSGDQKKAAKEMFGALKRMQDDATGASQRAAERANREMERFMRNARKMTDRLNDLSGLLDNLDFGTVDMTPTARPGRGATPRVSLEPTGPAIVGRNRAGGVIRRYAVGGLVPSLISSGEEIVEPDGRSWIVPGPRVAADNVFAMLPERSKVFTEHGQGLRAQGLADGQVLAEQLPHFAKGGRVQRFAGGGMAGRYEATAYGPPWGGIEGTGITSTGVDLPEAPTGRPGPFIVAVDPTVIPYHTKLKIWPNPFGWRGEFAAEDTGGAIRGNKLDFLDMIGREHQNAWGRRMVSVTNARGGGPWRGDGSATTSYSYVKKPAITHSRKRDLLQPYGASDAFGQGFQSGLDRRRRLFRNWRGLDTDLFRAATSGVRANERDRPKRIKVDLDGSMAKGRGKGVRSNGKTLQLPSSFGSTHQTAGLSGYPAVDVFASPGTAALSPASGVVSRLSGGLNTYSGPGGPFGHSIYLDSSRGQYYMTHFGSVGVRAGQRVRYGQPIGTVGDYPNADSDHIHIGLRGMRRGGIARFRRGGAVGSLVGSRAVGVPPTRTAPRYGRVSAPPPDSLSLIDQIGTQGTDASAVVGSMRDLAYMLETAKGVTYNRLSRLRQGVHDGITDLMKGGETGRERIQIRRLRGVLTLLEGEMGKRVGLIVGRAMEAVEEISTRQTRTSQRLALHGIDEGSVRGVSALRRDDVRSYRDLSLAYSGRDGQGGLRRELARARRMRDEDAVRTIRDAMRDNRSAARELQVSLVGRTRERASMRVESAVGSVQRRIDGAARIRTNVERSLALRGVDQGSSAGMFALRDADVQRQGAMERALGDRGRGTGLYAQLAAARRAKNRELARSIEETINAYGDEITQLGVDIQVSSREAAAQAAAEARAARFRPSEVASAMAGMTRGAGDDIAALQEQRRLWSEELAGAQASGNAEAIIEAANALAGIESSLQSLEQAQRQERYLPSNVRLALAQLTRDTGDDLAALGEQQAMLQQDLANAQASGDQEQIIEVATALAGVQSSIESLDRTLQDRQRSDEELKDLLRQQVENQRTLMAISQAQREALPAFLAAALSGNIGGRVGLGSQTPFFAGQGPRY